MDHFGAGINPPNLRSTTITNMKLTAIIYTTLLLSNTCNAVQKLGNAFKIDTRDPNEHYSSCLDVFDPSLDPSSKSSDSKDLNIIWDQINDMGKSS